MNTKFTDVAHLYIGCNCYYADKNITCETLGFYNGKATGKRISLAGDEHIPLWVEPGKLKPLLRPLVSITEFEAIELGKIILDEDVNHVCIITKDLKDDSVDISYSNKTERIVISCLQIAALRFDELDCINNYGNAMLWLTKKHFDIFGLIPAMEALELETTHERSDKPS